MKIDDVLTAREALEMGCQVSLRVGEVEMTFTPPLEETNETAVDFEIDDDLWAYIEELAAEVEDPEPLEGEHDWYHKEADPEEGTALHLKLVCRYQNMAVEHEGIGMDTVVYTYNEKYTVDVITQLLSTVEEIADKAHDAGVLPVGFEGLLRGMVDDIDALDAAEANEE